MASSAATLDVRSIGHAFHGTNTCSQSQPRVKSRVGASGTGEQRSRCDRYRRQGHPISNDGGHFGQGHPARTYPSTGTSRTGVSVQTPRPGSPRNTRSRAPSLPRSLLRSRLFLAPACGLPVRVRPSDKARILASQVRWQRGAGSPLEAPAPRSWVASRYCVGVRAPPRYVHGHIGGLGAMASRRVPRIRDRSPQAARRKLQQQVLATPPTDRG